MTPTDSAVRAVRTRALARYFAKLGATGFGGPVALVGEMRRELVDARGWFDAAEFSRGLALAQLAPGPLAAQLAMYLGWLRGGAVGALLCGGTFVVPSFLMVLVFSAVYVRIGDAWWLQRAFAGVGAAIVCILARAAWRLARALPRDDTALVGVALVNALAVLILKRESIPLLVASGAALVAVRTFTRRGYASSAFAFSMLGFGAGAAEQSAHATATLWHLLLFFSAAGAVVFGSGLAVMPFVYTELVEQRGWLTDQQFLDAVAVAMVSPGPVIVLVVFVGFLLAGTAGALVASVGVLGPALLVVLAAAPRLEQLMRYSGVRRFVDGITAGATGALIGAAGVIGARVVTGRGAGLLAAGVAIVILRYPRVADIHLIVAAAGVGVLLF